MNTRKLTLICIAICGLVLSACGGYENTPPGTATPTYADAFSLPPAVLKGD